ncbi:hypothetical protein KUCAC02_032674 [Chaenocephalus aceratus]|nr:hypothetical protein KUCAC02_032674 [Chaenocephalus aceratus]
MSDGEQLSLPAGDEPLHLLEADPGTKPTNNIDLFHNHSTFRRSRNTADVSDRKITTDEEEARRIAEMGKPVLGENSKLEVIIEESYEFKSTVDKLIKKTNLALVVGTNSWRDQFMEAITPKNISVSFQKLMQVESSLKALEKFHVGEIKKPSIIWSSCRSAVTASSLC